MINYLLILYLIIKKYLILNLLQEILKNHLKKKLLLNSLIHKNELDKS